MPRRDDRDQEIETLRRWHAEDHERQRERFRSWQLRSEELLLAATLLEDIVGGFSGLSPVERDEWSEAYRAFTATYGPRPMSHTTTAAREPIVYDKRPDGTFKRYPHWPIRRAYD